MRKSAPFLVIALLTLIVGFGFATIGNTRGDHKTLVGAVLYIFGGEVILHLYNNRLFMLKIIFPYQTFKNSL